MSVKVGQNICFSVTDFHNFYLSVLKWCPSVFLSWCLHDCFSTLMSRDKGTTWYSKMQRKGALKKLRVTSVVYEKLSAQWSTHTRVSIVPAICINKCRRTWEVSPQGRWRSPRSTLLPHFPGQERLSGLYSRVIAIITCTNSRLSAAVPLSCCLLCLSPYSCVSRLLALRHRVPVFISYWQWEPPAPAHPFEDRTMGECEPTIGHFLYCGSKGKED